MGFGPSAGWAQTLTDKATAAAGLPESQRVHIDRLPPREFPLWGSIADDVWAVEELAHGGKACGPRWLGRVEEVWGRDGVVVHPKKSIDAGEDVEVQGAMITARDHTVGVAAKKRPLLAECIVGIL
eukprot:8481733-Lingulodinium_polyedra.AAC.1